MGNKRPIELLAPARDLECGLAAVNAGADAIYLGGPRFGARENAGNSIEDIAKLVRYAHLFNVKVYITLNTVLFDHELEIAERLVKNVYEAGADALIIQDMAFLEMNLPPLPLHASTQTNNYDIEKIRLLSDAGFSRIVLARELTLEQIKEIRKITSAELEFFVHGSLCVSLSGQCYLSYAIGGRSANRGACAQPCRRKYTLTDKDGRIIASDKHLLSLKDLNLSEHIKALTEAGIDSLKIEGRLKDAAYVKNITAFYRKKLDAVIGDNESLIRPSSGTISLNFTPEPSKSFSRGATDYFLHGRSKNIFSFDSPKSLGEEIGTVKNVTTGWFEITTDKIISNNDGLAFVNRKGDSVGIKVNSSDGKRIFPDNMNGVFPGASIFRNYDHKFNILLNSEVAVRKLGVSIFMKPVAEGISIKAESENGIETAITFPYNQTPSNDKEKSLAILNSQITKTGGTPFEIKSIETGGCEKYFFQQSFLNNIRRKVLEDLKAKLESERSECTKLRSSQLDLKGQKESFEANISNLLSRNFYEKHGAEIISQAPEVSGEIIGKRVMTTKHCLRYSYGLCPLDGSSKKVSDTSVMYLNDGEIRLKLEFNCKDCFMNIIYEGKQLTK